jgi:phage baseplate assembly protein gpV
MSTHLDEPLVATLPVLTVHLGGRDLSAVAAATLGPVRIRSEASRPTACEIEVDADAPIGSVTPGDALVLTADAARLFTGTVVAVERRLGPDRTARLRIRGFDASHALRTHTDVTTYTDLTVAGLARTLAGRAGLGVDAAADSPRRQVLLQTGESDLTLLNRSCAAAGLWWLLDGSDLRLLDGRPDPVRTVSWGADVVEAVLGEDATAPTGPVRTVSWDPATRHAVSGSSTALASSSTAQAGGRTVVAPLLEHADWADALARSEAERQQAAARWVRAVLRGRSEWRPGLGLRVAEDASNTTYLLTVVEHVIDAVSGWVTIVDSRPVIEPAAATTGLTLMPGVVRDVDDPDKAGRIQVRFDALGGTDSDWLPVLALGASADKGFACQPDVGDTVAVLQPADAPGHGLVLGSIHVDAADDAAGVRGGAVRGVGLATPDGQRLALDRDTDGALLRNGAGSRLEITKSGVVLYAEADLTIAAPGHRLVIRANTVDFEKG